MKSMSEVVCDPSNSRSKLVRFSMDFLFNMNILGISGEEVEGCGGLRGAHVGDFNILKMDGCL